MKLTYRQAFDLSASLISGVELADTLFGVDAHACTLEVDMDDLEGITVYSPYTEPNQNAKV